MGEANSDQFCHCQGCLGKYTLLRDEENPRLAIFERQLPCCGCGIGWSSFLLGFLCPLIWYSAAILYFCKYYNRDPRERPGLAASAIAAFIFTVVTIITLSAILIICAYK
ncbi:large ribosomal subunit protein eL20z-like [Phragmites australis]|uniref:large ribosomal subunit protein eL20z-like n=1 Tax=Phragmites australis TaxID=29695 RepID=UPI002D799431|nr:large ribosomal subunit protein eL20z-like [Phragmites australis]XP_062194816.1 large ribosomal subunit protein eL20z-like [Phragmites australis]